MIQVGNALGWFVVVNQHYGVNFISHRFNHPWCLHPELIQGELGFIIDFAEGNGFRFVPQLVLVVRKSHCSGDRVRIRLLVSKN